MDACGGGRHRRGNIAVGRAAARRGLGLCTSGVQVAARSSGDVSWQALRRGEPWSGQKPLLCPETCNSHVCASPEQLGAGTALPSMAAALCGAESVVATDYDSHSCDAAARAAEHNWNVSGCAALGRVRVEQLDWRDTTAPNYRPSWGPVDVLIAADCNYYSEASPWLVAAVRAHLADGGTLLLASREGRAGLAPCLAMLRAEFSEVAHHAFSPQDHLWTFERRGRQVERPFWRVLLSGSASQERRATVLLTVCSFALLCTFLSRRR